MREHRIFIAINFPPKIKKALILYQKKWEDLPVRWTSEDNLHLTLVFLGYMREENLLEIFQIAKKVAKSHQSFPLNFQRIFLGPPQKVPRMFWVQGERNRELAFLRDDLEEELLGLKHKEEVRDFKSHITLGRIKMAEWQEFEKKPKIEEKISLTVPVRSIEIMESKLKPTGPDYFVLESIPLGK